MHETIYSIDIGKLYRAPVYNKVPLTISSEEDSAECGFLHPDEWFVLLDKKVSIRATKILTPSGEVGWVHWYSGTRFEQPDEE